MDTAVINGIAYEVVEQDGKRFIKKPAGGAGGGVTGYVLERLPDAPAAEPVAPAAHSVTLPQADAEAIEAAVEKAEADVHDQT